MIELKVDSSQATKKAFKIDGLADKLPGIVHDEVFKGAHRIRNRTIKSIARGIKSGTVYTWRGISSGEIPDAFRMSPFGKLYPVKLRNKPHRASAPGQAPATDTGELIASIIVDNRRNSIEVGATAKYAPWLEDGTRGMESRPFLEPALDKELSGIEKAVLNAIERASNL